jgi:hypothetical protein
LAAWLPVVPTVTMQKVVDSNPAQRLRESPNLLAFRHLERP